MTESEILARYKIGDEVRFRDVMTGTRKTGIVAGWGYDRDQRQREMIVETHVGEARVSLTNVIRSAYV